MPNFTKQTLYYVVDTVLLKRNTHNTPNKMSTTFKQIGQSKTSKSSKTIEISQKNFCLMSSRRYNKSQLCEK
jgi:hypothetical protein